MSQMLCFCSTLDNAVIDLERISNLLRLYCEHIESEYGSINPDEPWTAKVFLNRLPINQKYEPRVISAQAGFQIVGRVLK